MEDLSEFDAYDEQIELPPGFRFHPTDEELITHYLSAKVLDCSFSALAIGQVDLNKVEPWDLPCKAKMGEKEWYFFCLKDRKYPTGSRTNRATDSGYWKATGKDKEIFRDKSLVGMKKTLVFYRGRAPRGEKTNWVMHEFRSEGNNSIYNLPKSSKNEWVICRVFNKTSEEKKNEILRTTNYASESPDLPPLMEISSDENPTIFIEAVGSHVTCFSNRTEDPENNFIDEFTSYSSLKNANFSSLPFLYPEISSPNSTFSSQFNNTAMIQEHPFRHILLEKNDPSTKYIPKPEFSEMDFRAFEQQEFPDFSTCPIDLDCLWNY